MKQFVFYDEEEEERGEYRASTRAEDSSAPHLLYVRVERLQLHGRWHSAGLAVWDSHAGAWERYHVAPVSPDALQQALGLSPATPEATTETTQEQAAPAPPDALPALPFGKYRGKTIEEIAACDWGYLEWMARESIVRNGIDFSQAAWHWINSHAAPEVDVCPVCHETSCDGWHWKR